MSNRTLSHCPHCGHKLTVTAPRGSGGMTAEQFHDARNAACRAVAAEHGERWDRISGASQWCAIPSKLRSFKTARGTTIKCRADARLPAARYWPAGELPAGVTVTSTAPEYSVAELHRRYAARCAESRDTAREMALIAFRARRKGEFQRWKHEARAHETARIAALNYAADLETRRTPEPELEPEPPAPAAPAAPAPVTEPDLEPESCRVNSHSDDKPAPAAPAPADPILLAWYVTAVSSWRAYGSPDDAAALEQYRAACGELIDRLPTRGDGMAYANRQARLVKAIKTGKPFPTELFT